MVKKVSQKDEAHASEISTTKRVEAQPRKKVPRSAWSSGTYLPELEVPEGYHPYWVRNDPRSISKRLSVGYEFCNKLKYETQEFKGVDLRSNKNGVSGGIVIGDLIAMMLPDYLYKERLAALEEETIESTKAVVKEESLQERYGDSKTKLSSTVDGMTVVD